MSEQTQSAHQTKPATGICRWLEPASDGTARLLIQPEGGESRIYHVREEDDGWHLRRFVTDEQTGEVKLIDYAVTGDYWSAWRCNCPDATHHRSRRFACKHVRALKAALKALPF